MRISIFEKFVAFSCFFCEIATCLPLPFSRNYYIITKLVKIRTRKRNKFQQSQEKIDKFWPLFWDKICSTTEGEQLYSFARLYQEIHDRMS